MKTLYAFAPRPWWRAALLLVLLLVARLAAQTQAAGPGRLVGIGAGAPGSQAYTVAEAGADRGFCFAKYMP